MGNPILSRVHVAQDQPQTGAERRPYNRFPAAPMVIDARFSQQKYDAVVAAGSHCNLMNGYRIGEQLSKYKAGLSLMRLASSLTFVKPQQLGRSLNLLNGLILKQQKK